MELKENLISVVVGSYNGAEYIGEAIEGILKQTYENIELLLVDDGSKDDTLVIMKEYEKKDARIKVLHHENSGLSKTREAGYRAATGKYIIFSDDDDVWGPYMLEELLNIALKHSDVDAVVTFYKVFDNHNEITEYEWKDKSFYENDLKVKILTGYEFCKFNKNDKNARLCKSVWGILFKKELIDKLEPELMRVKDKIPTHYFNDGFLMPRVYGNVSKVALTNHLYVLYRRRKNSLCHNSKVPSTHVKHYMYAGEETLQYYKALGWKDVYSEALTGLYLYLLRTWYIVYAYEKNENERQYYLNETRRLYDKYYDELHSIKRKGINDIVVYFSIVLWNKFPLIWFKIIKLIKKW